MTQMVNRYPNGGAQAGKAYIGNLAATLCAYPRSVSIACADLLTGVTAGREFLPTPASIIAWCEPRKLDMKRSIDKEDEIEQQFEERARREAQYGYVPPLPYQRANVLVRPSAPGYAGYVQRSKTADPREFNVTQEGIWIDESWIIAPRYLGTGPTV